RSDELVETAPGWTVPEAPGSAYSDTERGDTKDLPASEAEPVSDPDVDWVQELKPVGEGGTLTAEPEAEAKAETKATAKPKRSKKPARRSRRKLADTEPEQQQEES